jgi:exopolyphosphatase/guanosine-5'-triphosphate,3'-diphosphate pyrophosphatase
MMPDAHSNQTVTVIEIGSTGIRLLVAEVFPDRSWQTLDQSWKPVALGRDVFTTGKVSRESFLECLSVLKNYRELLASWNITTEESAASVAIATSALRAASNRDVFVDRVKQETGFRVSIVEGIEENHLMYLAVRYALRDAVPHFSHSNSIILEVGGGSTEVMLLSHGKMVAAHSIKLGTILIDQKYRQTLSSHSARRRYLHEHIRNTQGFLNVDMDVSRITTFIAPGSDARAAALCLGAPANGDCRVIDRGDFFAFADRIREYHIEDCVRQLHISWAEAEGFVPGIMVHKLFLEKTAAREIIVPLVSIREGVLISRIQGVESGLQEEFYSQVTASAINLGRKYHFTEAHSRHVAGLALSIFDALTGEHGLVRRDRLLLEAAAILHDIGMFIKGSAHQKHGWYIIANSEIFGLQSEDLAIIAAAVLFHRGPPPTESDASYLALRREDRVLVLKLAAILRVADALDRSHSQPVKKLAVRRNGELMELIASPSGADFTMERLWLEEKGGLFQEVFGCRLTLTSP